ncbi:haloalkane dehalogenase [Desulfocicer vacuolatum DSM 3385]|uniref:Haloalkane dehalogenase n=1 Tax=Desulfocicer vacuolatum DSM 3385 TaxID=1121400 RepID=A0A1W2AFC0_9BACT|nr:alpha/beta fold hydrolase [Desulfocicer vacuolatum]SMC59313.1 haloalkane dehalogenase [Desulfocicer vacuolatum DSM 3385]
MERNINGKVLSTQKFASLYPFKPKHVNTRGHALYYLDEGSGPPVLMVHGNPTWSFYYRHLVKALSPNHRTIVPDHIGCGFSDKPDANAYQYTLQSRVEDLDTLINKLNLTEKISLIVHDWGGMIGLAWALDHLDRVDRIVITNTSGFFLPRGKKFPLRLWLLKYLAPFAIPAVQAGNIFSWAALYMAPRFPLSKQIKQGLTAPYDSWKNRIATLKFVQDIPLSPRDESYALVKKVEDNLQQLEKIPMMILWGRHDFVFDLSFLNEWKLRFPRVPVHLFDDAGHYLFEDKPGESTALIKKFMET